MINFGSFIALEFIETLSAPDLINILTSSTFVIPPPTVRGTKHDFDKTSNIFISNFLFSLKALMSKKIISSTSHLFRRSKGNLGLPMGLNCLQRHTLAKQYNLVWLKPCL